MSPGQRDLYLASLVLAAVATALLLGPVAYHRLVFRRGQKEGLVRAASVMAIVGLAVVGLAVSVSVLLVTSFVASGLTAGLITALIACMFALLWFAFPLARQALSAPHRARGNPATRTGPGRAANGWGAAPRGRPMKARSGPAASAAPAPPRGFASTSCHFPVARGWPVSAVV